MSIYGFRLTTKSKIKEYLIDKSRRFLEKLFGRTEYIPTEIPEEQYKKEIGEWIDKIQRKYNKR